MVLLQGIVIGRALMDAMREKSIQRATHTAHMYSRSRHRLIASRMKRRATAAPFESVFDDDLRVARMGGGTARRHFHTTASMQDKSDDLADVQTKFDDSDFINTKWTNIYRNTYIRQFALLSQSKIGQTLLTCAIVPGVHYRHYLGQFGLTEVIVADSVFVFALGMLVAMSFYLRHFVGVIALSDDQQWIRLAHMNFWGRRVNTYIPVEDIVPLSDVANVEQPTALCYVCRYSTAKRFFLLMHDQMCSVEHADHFIMVFGESYLTSESRQQQQSAVDDDNNSKEKTE